MTKKIIVLLSVLLLAVPALAKWDALPLPSPAFTDNLNAVYFTSTTEGMMVGANGSVLRTSSGGTAFSLTTESSVNFFNDVIFPTTTEGYLLGYPGQLWKSVDGGATFNLMFLPVELASADIRKGAFNGNNRVFAAYDSTAEASYLYTSADGGATFTASLATAIPSYEIRGVASTSTINLIWGYDPNLKLYTILKNGATEIWRSSSSSQAISDIYFVNDFIGYAVGSGGLIMRINIDTSGNVSYTPLNSGTAEPLNAVNFISPNYGWVVGEGRTILFTTNEGISFTPHVDPSLEPSLRDVFALLEAQTATLERPVVHAYIAGGNGHSYKLSSPLITNITPASVMQGWVGYVTVEGSGFMDKADIQFSGTQISVVSTAFDSESKLHAVTVIEPTTTVGTRDVAVENMDKTFSNEVGAFTVTANPNVASISNVWLSGTLYTPPPPTDVSLPPVSPPVRFDVTTTTTGAAINLSTLNAKVLIFNPAEGIYTQVIFIQPSEISLEALSSSINPSARISFKLPGIIHLVPPDNRVSLEVYAEDSLGNVATRRIDNLLVGSASDGSDGGGGVTGFEEVTAVPSKSVVYTSTSAKVTLMILPKGGIYYPEGLTLFFFGMDAKPLGSQFIPGPIGGKINVEIDTSKYGGGDIGTQAIIVKAQDNATKRFLKGIPPIFVVN